MIPIVQKAPPYKHHHLCIKIKISLYLWKRTSSMKWLIDLLCPIKNKLGINERNSHHFSKAFSRVLFLVSASFLTSPMLIENRRRTFCMHGFFIVGNLRFPFSSTSSFPGSNFKSKIRWMPLRRCAYTLLFNLIMLHSMHFPRWFLIPFDQRRADWKFYCFAQSTPKACKNGNQGYKVYYMMHF